MSGLLTALNWLLKIFAEWPARRTQRTQEKRDDSRESWSDFRAEYEKKKADRARRAALLRAAIMRPTKGELQ